MHITLKNCNFLHDSPIYFYFYQYFKNTFFFLKKILPKPRELKQKKKKDTQLVYSIQIILKRKQTEGYPIGKGDKS